MTLLMLIGVFATLVFFALLRNNKPQVVIAGPTPDEIYNAYQRSRPATLTSAYRPFNGKDQGNSQALEHMFHLRDSEIQNRNNERNFLTRELNFTEREMKKFDRIHENHELALQSLTGKTAEIHLLTKNLLGRKREALVKLMGVKRYETYKAYRKTQNTETGH